MTRRDICLQQMGVIRWRLRNPAALRGVVSVTLTDDVQLLIIAHPPVPPGDLLIADVLRALQLTENQALAITPEQATLLNGCRCCHSWWLGVPPQTLTGLHLPAGLQLQSPALDSLRRSAAARAELWQQIYQHEQPLFSHHSPADSG